MENQARCSPPDSSVLGIPQATRTLEWVPCPPSLPGHLPHPRIEPGSGVVVGPCHDHGWWRFSTDTSVSQREETRGSEGRENEEGGGGGLMKKERGISWLGEWKTCRLGRAGRLPTSGRAPQREVMVVSVNGAPAWLSRSQQVQAWAQRELELGQGSKAGAGGSGGWAGSGERWPQCTWEAEPFWWKSDDRGCPGPLKDSVD